MRHYSYMHYIHTLLYLPLDFTVAYAANISEHLTIRWEIDHHTRNYVTYSFRTLRNVMRGQSSFVNKPIKPYSTQECIGLFAKWDNSMLRNCLLLRSAYMFYITCICTCLPCAVVKNGNIILFAQRWCVRLEWNTAAFPLTNAFVA